ncbi:MAG: hypothetical protein IKS46_03410 [Clostridia bacterium]|nr:hypothetical protein [Clostridia bacterium]
MNRKRIITLITLVTIIAAAFAWMAETASCRAAADQLVTCYAMCKPGSRVTIRRTPSKKGAEAGYLDCGDSFQTDAEAVNGWFRCYGAGENGWVYCGYVATEKPEKIGMRYICASTAPVICRRWIGGPKVEKHPYIQNGETLEVFVTDGEWAVTSRGYVKIEYFDPDPE